MKVVTLKESDISKLKEYPLNNIISTESKIYYYKKDKNWNSILLKKLYRTEEENINRKIKTLEAVQKSELVTYKELIFPQKVVSIQGIKSGFTIKEVVNSKNLHIMLNDNSIPTFKKVEILKKIGVLLQKVQSQKQEFYFGDLQDYNFLIDSMENIYAIDLDSAAVSKEIPLETKYIAIDKKTHNIDKYKVNKNSKSYPSKQTDIFCYNTMILNFLSNISISHLNFADYYNYLKYLEKIGFPKEMINIYRNHYTEKENESVLDMLEDLPKQLELVQYKNYKK